MKRYTELTAPEKVALTDETFQESVKLEAAARGIELPITLDEAMKQKPYVGYTIPADSVPFYEVLVPSKYGDPKPSGLCFVTEAAATAATRGAFAIHEDGYDRNAKHIIVKGDLCVVIRHVYGRKVETLQEHLKEFEQDLTAFTALADECAKDWREVNQTAYDRQVQLRRRQTYLDLAKGDKSIAMGFWATTYPGAEWPEGD